MEPTPTAATVISSPAPSENAEHHEQEPDALFQMLRTHVDIAGVAASVPTDTVVTPAGKRIVVGGITIAAAAKAETLSKVADSTAANTFSCTREDAFGEAETMAADEGRSSPPSPPPGRSLDYHHQRRGRRQAPSPHQFSIGETNTLTPSSHDAPSCGSRAQQGGSDGCRAAVTVAASGSLFVGSHGGRSSSPTAPAYEPSLLNNHSSSTVNATWRYKPEASRNERFGGSVEDPQHQQQRHDQTAAFRHNGNLQQLKANGASSASHTASLSTPAGTCGENAELKLQAEVEGNILRQKERGQAPASLRLRGEKLPSPQADRKVFLSTMKKSGDAYQNVRQDLQEYMEGVRARWVDFVSRVGVDVFPITKCLVVYFTHT